LTFGLTVRTYDVCNNSRNFFNPIYYCCTDGKHCCPEGTTCDVSSGKCNRGDLAVVDWIEKVPAIITDVICPDGQSKCQTGQTCCKLAINHGSTFSIIDEFKVKSQTMTILICQGFYVYLCRAPTTLKSEGEVTSLSGEVICKSER
jgi:hypothetical protein